MNQVTILLRLLWNRIRLLGLTRATPLVEESRRVRVVARENIFALAILLFFLFCGPTLLGVLHIGRESLHIAGGVLLFLISVPVHTASLPGQPLFGDPHTGGTGSFANQNHRSRRRISGSKSGQLRTNQYSQHRPFAARDCIQRLKGRCNPQHPDHIAVCRRRRHGFHACLAMNGRIFDPARTRKNVGDNCFEESQLYARKTHTPLGAWSESGSRRFQSLADTPELAKRSTWNHSTETNCETN